MAKKTIVLVREGFLNNQTNNFEFYRSPKPFTTLKLANEYITKAFEINKGFNWLEDKDVLNPIDCIKQQVYQYDCLSTDNNLMILKYLVEVKELNKFY